MSYFLNSIRKELNGIKSVGGWKAAWSRILRECYIRVGTHVGTDKYGNKYYENNSYFFSRHRFVCYPYVDRYTFDASQVPSEWHRWLHYMTDDPPTKVPPVPRKFFQPHEPNKTGSKMEYVPYSTTRPKIEEWVPPKGNWLTGFHYLQLLITPGCCFVQIKKMLYEKCKGINDLNDRALCHYCVLWILECSSIIMP